MISKSLTHKFSAPIIIGSLKQSPVNEPDSNTATYTAIAVGDGIQYTFKPGVLADYNWLTFDLLLSGNQLAVFELTLIEDGSDRRFKYVYSVLCECGARLRMPLDATKQNRWLYEREGAFLKPMCFGDRVDLASVCCATISLFRKGPKPVKWQQSPLYATVDEPELLSSPALPMGKLVDEFGQTTLADWKQKTKSSRELVDGLNSKLAASASKCFPSSYSRYGGDAVNVTYGTGFFRTWNDGSRWWLIDPDGHPFWSAGVDCVAPHVDANIRGIADAVPNALETGGPGSINYLESNLKRAFGDDWYENWIKISISQLRDWGFNTVANWSDIAAASMSDIPYVRPLDFRPRRTAMVYRDFPDVFSDSFETDTDEYASALEITKDDPALIGYFLMNEPTWGFSTESPAQGMLLMGTESCSRIKLAEFLREKYETDQNLAEAWASNCSFDQVSTGPWRCSLNDIAIADLESFSSVMIDHYFGALTRACQFVDPNHLNLGARYYTMPPDWAIPGMRHFDVFSVNCYDSLVKPAFGEASDKLGMPVMIGEWHFGALDVGLPATGIGHVANQTERGRAYRRYVEDAAAKPWCVGVHYFTLYDQSCLGRFDGENYNIGLIDVCHNEYVEMIQGVTSAHSAIYKIATGQSQPFNEQVDYLPPLFM